MTRNSFSYFKSPHKLIQLTVVMYIRFPLSLRNAEDLLHERRVDVCHESIGLWVGLFGTLFAGKIRRQRSNCLHQLTQWELHLDEVLVKINGETNYMWRAIDYEGEILEACITEKHDKTVALKLLKKHMKRYGSHQQVATDRLKSYGAAMKEIGNKQRQQVERWKKNRCENSRLPFGRKERATLRFRRMRSLQKFASMHAVLYNHFNGERHLNNRQVFKQYQSEALSEWPPLAEMAA